MFKHLEVKDGMPSNQINAIYKDSLDNIWIGSYGKGLYKYSSSDRGINQLLSIRKTHSPITSIALLQDKILLGTLGDGMYHFDMRTSTEKENSLLSTKNRK